MNSRIFLTVCGACLGMFVGFNFSPTLTAIGIGGCIGAIGAYFYG